MYKAILIVHKNSRYKKQETHNYQSIETIEDMGLERDEDARIIPGTSQYRGKHTKNTQGHSPISQRDH